jgi:hypothetical protein
MKADDWYFDDCELLRKSITSNEDYWFNRTSYVKVIATTDPVLIGEGVLPIDPQYQPKYLVQKATVHIEMNYTMGKVTKGRNTIGVGLSEGIPVLGLSGYALITVTPNEPQIKMVRSHVEIEMPNGDRYSIKATNNAIYINLQSDDRSLVVRPRVSNEVALTAIEINYTK